MSKIGDRIKQRRIELGLSQDELATMLGYKSRSSINKIERDGQNLPQPKITQIARALNVKPSYIMGWEQESGVFYGIDSKFFGKQEVHVLLTEEEFALIKKYRQLDADGKADINDLIDSKLARAERAAKEQEEGLG